MPVYTFEIAPFLAGRSVTVRDASGASVASGTLDENARFTATLAVGDYVASASDGNYTYRASGVVDQGDPDRLADSSLSSTYGVKASPLSAMAAPVIIDGARNYNGTPFQQDAFVIRDGFLFVVLVGRGRNVIIAKKPVDGGTWETFNLSTMPNSAMGVNNTDGHNVISLGIDAQGYIHVSGNMHGNPLRYVKSVNPLDISAWATATMIGTNEASVTYPAFVKLANGRLLFAYREGGYGFVLNRQKSDGTWERLHNLLNQSGSTPYVDRIAVADNGTVHVMGTWRANTGTTADSNNDIFHIRSLDNGTTWQTISGVPLTTPVGQTVTSTVIDTAPSGSGLVNQTGVCVDTKGNPHKVAWFYDASGKTQFYHVWHDGSAWRNDKVTAFTSRVETAVTTLTASLSRGGAIATPDGRVFLMYRQNSDGLRGSIRLRDITPASYGLPSLGDFPILSIDTWYSDPAATVSNGKLMLLAPCTGPDTVGHVDQPTLEIWTSAFAVLVQLDLATLGQYAQNPSAPHVRVETSTTTNADTSVSALESTAFTGVLPAMVPPRFGDRFLMARVRGFASSTGSATGTIEVVGAPASGLGTVLASPVVTGAQQPFFTPWLPLDLYYGSWDAGGKVQLRGYSSDGTAVTVHSCAIDIGVGVQGDGSAMLGPVGQVPLTDFPYGQVIADWDAANVTGVANGGSVTALQDASGARLHLNSVLGAPTLVTAGIGGKPSLQFSGGQCLQSPVVTIGQTYTVFIVGLWGNTGVTPQVLVSQDTSTGNKRVFQHQIANGTTVNAVTFSGTAGVTDTATGTTTAPFVMEVVRSRTGSTTYSIEAFLNGASNGSTATNASTWALATYIDLGARSDGAAKQYLNGQIAKVLIYKGGLSATDRAAIRAQLGARYGITVT